MGLLDDAADSGLIGGLASAGQGFMQGYSHAEDRKYKRMELEAKQRAETLEKDRNKSNQNFQNEEKLRDDWLGNHTTKTSQTVQEAYRKIQTSPNTAAGDMSLIYGINKIMDPGSTVREGEFANAQATTGMMGRLQQLYVQAQNGKRLTPEQRRDFLNTAAQLQGSQRTQQTQFDDQFKGLARSYDANPDRIVLKIFEDPQTGEQKVIPVKVPAQIQGAKKAGLVSKPSSGLVQGGDQKSKEMSRMQELLKKKVGG